MKAKRERQDKKVGENYSWDPTQPMSEYSLLPQQYQNIAHQRAQCLNHRLTFRISSAIYIPEIALGSAGQRWAALVAAIAILKQR